MRVVLLLLLPTASYCLGPLSLFGSPYLYRQYSYPANHRAGRANRGQYARLYGRWGQDLIFQLGRGHHVSHHGRDKNVRLLRDRYTRIPRHRYSDNGYRNNNVRIHNGVGYRDHGRYSDMRYRGDSRSGYRILDTLYIQ